MVIWCRQSPGHCRCLKLTMETITNRTVLFGLIYLEQQSSQNQAVWAVVQSVIWMYEYSKNYEKNNAWNIRRLVNESFVPATQQTSVLYCRLSDFLSWFFLLLMIMTSEVKISGFCVIMHACQFVCVKSSASHSSYRLKYVRCHIRQINLPLNYSRHCNFLRVKYVPCTFFTNIAIHALEFITDN